MKDFTFIYILLSILALNAAFTHRRITDKLDILTRLRCIEGTR